MLRSGTGGTTRQTSTFDIQTVIFSIPSRCVTLYGFGRQGARAVDQLEPSPLSRLLAPHLPTAVPAGWRRISDGIVSVSVPPAWHITKLNGNVVNLGVCEAPYFAHPAAFLGMGGAIAYCTLKTAEIQADATVGPGNGVWLAGMHALRLSVVFTPPGTSMQALRISGLAVTISYPRAPNGSNSVLVRVVASGRPHYLVLGLGLQPTIAESILSSLQVG